MYPTPYTLETTIRLETERRLAAAEAVRYGPPAGILNFVASLSGAFARLAARVEGWAKHDAQPSTRASAQAPASTQARAGW